jgi:hypothetical protein
LYVKIEKRKHFIKRIILKYESCCKISGVVPLSFSTFIIG